MKDLYEVITKSGLKICHIVEDITEERDSWGWEESCVRLVEKSVWIPVEMRDDQIHGLLWGEVYR